MFRKSKALAIAFLMVVVTLFPTPAHATSCTPQRQLASQNIRQLHVEVINATNGQVLFAQNESAAERSASVMKVVTAAVALDVLGPDYRVTTNVYHDPSNPGDIYLVGAGDITLSRMPGNITSFYPKAPKLDTLTRQIANWSSASGTAVKNVYVDSSLFGGDNEWHPTWSKRGLSSGYMAPVSALQIDAGRFTAGNGSTRFIAKRTATPVNQAGRLFITSLNKRNLAPGIVAQQQVLPEGAEVIASVQSRPMREWIIQSLRVSDNSLSEALGRLSSLKAGFDGTMASLTPLYKQVLGARGIDVSNIEIIDASGLSRNNKIPVTFVNDILELVHEGVGDYQVIEAGMPVSGQAGSLRSRFAAGTLREARGKVVAKTGYITTGYSLAGFMTARDGTKLIFSVYNLTNRARFGERQAMDNLVYRFYQCGARLSS